MVEYSTLSCLYGGKQTTRHLNIRNELESKCKFYLRPLIVAHTINLKTSSMILTSTSVLYYWIYWDVVWMYSFEISCLYCLCYRYSFFLIGWTSSDLILLEKKDCIGCLCYKGIYSFLHIVSYSIFLKRVAILWLYT